MEGLRFWGYHLLCLKIALQNGEANIIIYLYIYIYKWLYTLLLYVCIYIYLHIYLWGLDQIFCSWKPASSLKKKSSLANSFVNSSGIVSVIVYDIRIILEKGHSSDCQNTFVRLHIQIWRFPVFVPNYKPTDHVIPLRQDKSTIYPSELRQDLGSWYRLGHPLKDTSEKGEHKALPLVFFNVWLLVY